MSRLARSEGWTEALAHAADAEAIVQSLIEDITWLEDNGKQYENFHQFIHLANTARENQQEQEDEQDQV